MTKMKARVRNFQAIEDVKIEIEGLTVVTGRSNLGKTALIRALSAMMYGLPGDYYVKRGQDFSGGAMTHDDPKSPLKIIWRKVPSTKRKPNLQPVLEINGTTHTKIGRDHKALTAPLGIQEIQTAASNLRPQVAMQHDPIFLVGESETTVAEVFKLLGRVDIITEAQKLAKKDLRDNESTRKVRSKDHSDAEERKTKLSHVPSLRPRLEDLKALCQAELEGIEGRKASATLLQDLANLISRSLPTVPPAAVQPRTADLVNLLRELPQTVSTVLPEQAPAALSLPDLAVLNLLRELKQVTNEHYLAAREVSDCQGELDTLAEERKAMEAELGTCPTCERSFEEHAHT